MAEWVQLQGFIISLDETQLDYSCNDNITEKQVTFEDAVVAEVWVNRHALPTIQLKPCYARC